MNILSFRNALLLASFVSLIYVGSVDARGGERGGSHHMEEHPNMNRGNFDHRGMEGNYHHPEARAFEEGAAAGSAVGGAAAGAGDVEVVPEYVAPPPVYTAPPR